MKIYLDDCGQPPAWYASQKKKLAQSFAAAFAIALEVGAGPEDAAKFRAECAEVGEQVGDLVKGVDENE